MASSSQTPVIVPDAPPSPASFSSGIVSGRLLQVSGQGPLDSSGAVLADLDVEGQTTVTLDHVRRILEAGGGSFADVVMLRVNLTDRADFAGMNRAFEKYVAEHRKGFGPARTTVMVGLPFEGMLVEIDALAVLPETE